MAVLERSKSSSLFRASDYWRLPYGKSLVVKMLPLWAAGIRRRRTGRPGTSSLGQGQDNACNLPLAPALPLKHAFDIYIHTCIHTYIHTFILKYINYIQTYIPTYLPTYIHTYMTPRFRLHELVGSFRAGLEKGKSRLRLVARGPSPAQIARPQRPKPPEPPELVTLDGGGNQSLLQHLPRKSHGTSEGS